MSSISFSPSSPKAYILAVDGLLSAYDPDHDQVWSFTAGGTDQQIFQLETTYSLQAKSMRLLPFFTINRQPITKSSSFSQAPQVKSATPATLHLLFGLPNGLEISWRCFVPKSRVLMGSAEFHNTNAEPIHIQFDLAAILAPMEEGLSINPQKIGNNHILSGRTGDIWPTLFMSGGPKPISNPYPALSKQFALPGNESQSLTWVLVSRGSQKASFEEARSLTATNWQKQAANHVRQNDADTLHIKTGDPDWDAAFSLAQSIARTHLAKGDRKTSHPITIKTRMPDQSIVNIKKNQPIQELSVLETSHLAQILLPTQVDLMLLYLENLLDRLIKDQASTPSNNASSSNLIFPRFPMIAHLLMQSLKIKPDEEILNRVFPLITTLFERWLPQKPEQLASQFPVIETPQQLQLNTGDYKFDIWHRYGGGLDIQTVISPALAAMLYRESSTLQKMAYQRRDLKALRYFSALRKSARNILTACWHDETQMFTYLDHQSNHRTTREWIASGKAQPIIPINRQFSVPQRIICHLFTEDEDTRNCVVSFEGISETGELLIEEVKIPSYRWIMGCAHITTRFLFDTLQIVTIEGLSANDHYRLENVDHLQPDITCLLPIWSGGANKKFYQSLLQSRQENLKESWKKGIPETWEGSNNLPEGMPISVNVLWNTLIIEGMLRQGFLEESAVIFSNLMGTIIQGLKDFDGFYPYYSSQNGQPAGTKNSVTGLPPIRLFLEIGGIKLFTPNRLATWGVNPFPWPISLQWQGLSLTKDGSNTQVIFPNGAQYTHNGTKPVLISPKSSAFWREATF